MNVLIRVDASLQIGTGHVMRCITLAGALRQRGTAVSFVCREMPGHLCDFIETEGFIVHRLPHDTAQAKGMADTPGYVRWLEATPVQDASETGMAVAASNLPVDWLVVDHYALNRSWERAARNFARNIMVIDDLANRRHDCDLLLDQNLYGNMETRYDGLIPPDTLMLLGPAFALLRPEFAILKKNREIRTGDIMKILVFFGGSDVSNVTLKAIEAIVLSRSKGVAVDVVIGINNPNREAIEATAIRLPDVKCHFNVRDMAKLMMDADLCIGAAGGTTWERCCLGLPAMVVTVAENQVETTRWLHEKSILYFIGMHSSVSPNDIAEAIDLFCGKPGLVRRYSGNSMALVDGTGVQKCMDHMLSARNMRESWI